MREVRLKWWWLQQLGVGEGDSHPFIHHCSQCRPNFTHLVSGSVSFLFVGLKNIKKGFKTGKMVCLYQYHHIVFFLEFAHIVCFFETKSRVWPGGMQRRQEIPKTGYQKTQKLIGPIIK